MAEYEGADSFQAEDVDRLRFGSDFEGVHFLSNAAAAILLETQFKTKNAVSGARPAEAFAKSLAYSSATMGAVQTRDPAAIDELFTGLQALAFSREGPDGEMLSEKLHGFEVAVLANLNPSTVEAAQGLVPSLARFSRDEVLEVLTLLRRSSTKLAGVGGSE